LARRRLVRYAFLVILFIVTFAFSEVAFRVFDYVTMPKDNLNLDVWIRNISEQVQEHPSLGYQYRPLFAFD